MLYRLIWGRFIACQMTNAVYDNVQIDAVCEGNVFKASFSELVFPGCTAVYDDTKDEETAPARKPLPNLQEGEQLELKNLDKEQKFTQPPPRYTEATLIRAMEEKGIGRPSTYAPTITTILSHEYVVKEGRYLRPTALGETVTGLMEERFPDIVDLKFTARMEDGLDDIEKGKEGWRDYLSGFYGGFEKEMKDAETAMEGRPHQGAGRGVRGSVPRLRAQPGDKIRPLRPLPGLPGLSRVQLHHAHRGGDARQVPQVRQPHTQAHLQARLHLLRLRAWGRVRLHDLGRAHQGGLPRVRQDDVQALRPRAHEGLLHQRELPQLHA